MGYEYPYCKIATGSYTGDGAVSQGITGLGFRPKFIKIIIYNEVGDNSIRQWYCSDTYTSNFADEHINGVDAMLPDRVISLDADGFSVDDQGADGHPNKATFTYRYVAFGR